MIRILEGQKGKVCTDQQVHEACQTPKRLHLILRDKQDRGEEIAHPLDVTWMTQMKRRVRKSTHLFNLGF